MDRQESPKGSVFKYCSIVVRSFVDSNKDMTAEIKVRNAVENRCDPGNSRPLGLDCRQSNNYETWDLNLDAE